MVNDKESPTTTTAGQSANILAANVQSSPLSWVAFRKDKAMDWSEFQPIVPVHDEPFALEVIRTVYSKSSSKGPGNDGIHIFYRGVEPIEGLYRGMVWRHIGCKDPAGNPDYFTLMSLPWGSAHRFELNRAGTGAIPILRYVGPVELIS